MWQNVICHSVFVLSVLCGGGVTSGTIGGKSPGCFFSVLPKRSIPKPDQHRKDIIQQESLCTDMV